MIVVVAVVVHSRRAFLGGAAAGVVGDVGADVTGRCSLWLPCRNDRAHARTWLFQRCGARWSRRVSFRERGSPGSINHGKGKGESLTSPLSLCSFASYLLPGCTLCQSRPRSFRS
jgi:hypothetical protein